jgi:hypothetical protein
MDWITALLAFAVTMLFFSVVVSTLVELIHRTFRMREAGLYQLLQNYYGEVVKPSLSGTDPWSKPVTVDEKEVLRGPTEFADLLCENRAFQREKLGKRFGPLAAFGNWLNGGIDWTTSASFVSHMPVEVFMQKLAASGVFAATKFETPEGAKILQDFGQKFIAFGSEMSEAFERRARVFSIIIALIVAFLFFVHPYRIAVAYLADPARAQRIADLRDEILAKQEQLTADRTEQTAPETSKPPQSSETSPSSTPESTSTPSADENAAQDQQEVREPTSDAETGDDAGGSSTAANDSKTVIDGILKDIDALNSEVREVADLGVPIGWPADADVASIAPCAGGTAPALRADLDAFCTSTNGAVRPTAGSIFWLIIGGMLIGLGSPFWAKVINAVTPIKDVAGKIGEVLDGARQKEDKASTAKPSAAVEAFRAAASNRPS